MSHPKKRSMRIFQHGKSYVWIFFVFAVFFVGFGMIGKDPKLAAFSMPILIGGILVCELQSGIALDSWWRAKYERGSWQYTALVIWHVFVTILLSILAWLY
jgi:hypothetical protein